VNVSTSGRISQLRAISFDGDMTLWDFEKVMRHSLGGALTELRARLPEGKCADLTVDRMIEIRNAVAEERKGERIALESIRLEAFRRTIEMVGGNNDELAAELNSIYLKHRLPRSNSTPTFCRCWMPSPAGMCSDLYLTGTAILSDAGCTAASAL